MRLTKQIIRCANKFKTPFLLIDLTQLKTNYHYLKLLLPGIEIFYAMKANDHPIICKTLLDEGASFEIASLNEAKKLLHIGVQSTQIVCFNPVKSPEFLEWMYAKKIKIMAFDSYEELDKISKYSPQSKVVLRITVPEEGSFFPLGNKFGADPNDAADMLLYARSKGLQPYGLTIHVGSQCINGKNWMTALQICKKIYDQLKKHNIALTLISLGGGIPIAYLQPIPPLSKIASDILSAIKNFRNDNVIFTIEPGRGIVATAGTMISTVVGVSTRKKEQWIYLDVGVFNGLMEILGEFRFNIVSERKNENILTSIAGPSCDSYDILAKHINFPQVKILDKIYILDVGCYSTVYASAFNGFEIPKTYFLN